jgi:alcohol dehydrogenase class IV
MKLKDSALQFFSPKTIITGIDAVNSVVEEIRKLGGTKVLVVTDPGIINAGLVEPLLDLIRKESIPVDVFDDVNPDPELGKVEACASYLKDGSHDLVIGFGGGSPIDVAKYSAVFVKHAGEVRDYLGRHMLQRRGLPTIMIPTTAGTGSEVTWAAVFHDEADHVKKAVWSPFQRADTVIVDPSLTLTMPHELTIDTGIDALVHALEAYVARDSSHLTDALAIKAIWLVNKSLRTVVEDGSNLEGRYDMSVAAMIAGLAFCNAGLGAIHAMALLLDGEYGFTHGRSLTVLAPAIMNFNVSANPAKYAQIADALGERTAKLEEEGGRKAITAVTKLVNDLGVPIRLRDYGIEKDKLEQMGKRAFEIGQRLLPMNPRPMGEDDSVRIYQDAY